MKKSSMAKCTGLPHSPRNGEIVNGKVYDRKFAFVRDDKYQLIDKAYNPTYKSYINEIVNILVNRVDKNNFLYKYQIVQYLCQKEANFVRKNSENGTKIKSPFNKFREITEGFNTVTPKTVTPKPKPKNDDIFIDLNKILTSDSGNKIVIKIKKVKKLTVINK